MNASLEILTKLKKEYEALLPFPQEVQLIYDKKIRLEFNYNSNHIEGNTLTYRQTELLLLKNIISGTHDKRDLDEMLAHDLAFSMIKDWATDESRSLLEADIRQLNKNILVRNFWKEAVSPEGQNTRREIKVGDYKEYPNSVRQQNGELFEYASPTDTPLKMKELMECFNNSTQAEKYHPIELAARFHHKFILIHPFDDGNGRLARLLVNFILFRHGYPPIIIKSKDKKNYLFALAKADAGDIHSFIEYISNCLVDSLELAIKAGKGESIEEMNDWEKELSLLERKGDTAPPLRDDELTTNRLLDSVAPLLSKIEELLNSKFNNLFESTQIMSFKNGADISFLRLENFRAKEQLLSSFQNLNSLSRIETNLNLKKYKKKRNQFFRYSYSLVIKF